MNTDGIWKLFCETGNVSCYLMYKEMARRDKQNEERKNASASQLSYENNRIS